MFYDCSSLSYISDISDWSTNKVNDMSYMFYNCPSLSTLPDIYKWNVKNVINMNYMFYNCSSLLSLPNICNWEISNVKNMDYMFYNCKLLIRSFDIQKFKKNKNIKMHKMFSYYNLYDKLSLPLLILSFLLIFFKHIPLFIFLAYSYVVGFIFPFILIFCSINSDKIKPYIDYPPYNIEFTKINKNIEFQKNKKNFYILKFLLLIIFILFYIFSLCIQKTYIFYLLSILLISNNIFNFLNLKIFFRLKNSFEEFQNIINSKLEENKKIDLGNFDLEIIGSILNIIFISSFFLLWTCTYLDFYFTKKSVDNDNEKISKGTSEEISDSSSTDIDSEVQNYISLTNEENYEIDSFNEYNL